VRHDATRYIESDAFNDIIVLHTPHQKASVSTQKLKAKCVGIRVFISHGSFLDASSEIFSAIACPKGMVSSRKVY
jgi:hypothetical protein